MEKINDNLPERFSPEQQKAIIDTDKIVEEISKTIDEVGQIKALTWVSKLATVAALQKIQILKENKGYLGIPYVDDSGIKQRVASWEDFCVYKLFSSRRTVDNNLLNLRELGESFFNFSKLVGLGDRELRKLRQYTEEERSMIINSEAVDMGDKEAVKDLIEDCELKHEKEKQELTQELDETKQTLGVAREISNGKQKEIDSMKEQKAKRNFSQEPWEQEVMESFEGLMHAGMNIIQGINQIRGIYEQLNNSHSLNEKSSEYIARGIFSKIEECRKYHNEFLDDVILNCERYAVTGFDSDDYFFRREYPEAFEDGKTPDRLHESLPTPEEAIASGIYKRST